MEIRRPATAGTHASSDVFIALTPASDLKIDIHSPIAQQFGRAIEATVHELFAEEGVKTGHVVIHDHGALDCTLRARLLTALERSTGDAV